MSFLKAISLEKKHRVHTHHKVFVNQDCVVEYGDPKNNTTFGFIGSAGRGKTVSLFATADQFENAIYFDPKGGSSEAVRFLSIQGHWEQYAIKKIKNSPVTKYLEINASELTEDIENILSFKRKLEDKARISNCLREFLSMRKEERTYETLKRVFFQRKLPFVMEDLEPILSQTDSGITVKEACKGQKVVDIVGLSIENRCIAIFLTLIIGYKRRLKGVEERTGKRLIEPLFVGCDDCQTYAVQSTALGKAFEISFSEGRQFVISSCLAGTNRGKLAPSIKGNMTTLFIFASKTEVNSFWEKEKIDVDITKLKELDELYGTKGNFYLHSEENPELCQYAHYDVKYYQRLRQQGSLKHFSNLEKAKAITRFARLV